MYPEKYILLVYLQHKMAQMKTVLFALDLGTVMDVLRGIAHYHNFIDYTYCQNMFGHSM